MCPRDKHTRPHGIMDQGLYESSIDEVVELGAKQVTLTGFGEPLLDRNLEKKISYAKSKGLRTYIITNGSALFKRAESLANSGLDELRVSFYGMSTETYNKNMKGLDFNRAVEGVERFLRLRKDTKVQLSYLILDNEPYQDFLDYWESKVDYVEVWRPHNWSDGRQYRELTGDKASCGRPMNGPLQIQWDGTVIPCCYDYNNSIVLGNAFRAPVLTVLHGQPYNDLRQAHQAGEFEKYPFCNNCDQLREHSDALIYTNRHNLPKSEAVKLSNTDLHQLKA